MPKPYLPARAAGAARGLRIVEGEPSAAARAGALRARLAKDPKALDLSLNVHGPEGGAPRTRVIRRATTYSPTATLEQQVRSEALRRHAGKVEDPRGWASELDDAPGAAAFDAEVVTAGQRYAQRMLDAFEKKYGRRPPTWEEAKRSLSAEELFTFMREH